MKTDSKSCIKDIFLKNQFSIGLFTMFSGAFNYKNKEIVNFIFLFIYHGQGVHLGIYTKNTPRLDT
jgi:hypothetical protein